MSLNEKCSGCGLTLYRGMDNRCAACSYPAPPKPKEKNDREERSL
jgi:ribosomal protein L37E